MEVIFIWRGDLFDSIEIEKYSTKLCVPIKNHNVRFMLPFDESKRITNYGNHTKASFPLFIPSFNKIILYESFVSCIIKNTHRLNTDIFKKRDHFFIIIDYNLFFLYYKVFRKTLCKDIRILVLKKILKLYLFKSHVSIKNCFYGKDKDKCIVLEKYTSFFTNHHKNWCKKLIFQNVFV